MYELEVALQNINAEIEADELFFDIIDEFMDLKKKEDSEIIKKLGKLNIIFTGHFENGTSDEEDCVYIKEIIINGKKIMVDSYF